MFNVHAQAQAAVFSFPYPKRYVDNKNEIFPLRPVAFGHNQNEIELTF